MHGVSGPFERYGSSILKVDPLRAYGEICGHAGVT